MRREDRELIQRVLQFRLPDDTALCFVGRLEAIGNFLVILQELYDPLRIRIIQLIVQSADETRILVTEPGKLFQIDLPLPLVKSTRIPLDGIDAT